MQDAMPRGVPIFRHFLRSLFTSRLMHEVAAEDSAHSILQEMG